MARRIIAVGSAGNDGTGDTLRAGAIKINQNFEEVFADLASIGLLVTDSVGGLNLEGISFDQRSVVFIGVDSPNSPAGADNNETFLRATEPTKDNIITLPDSTGTVAFVSDITRLALDSAAVTALKPTFGTNFIDSATSITLTKENSIDSTGVIGLIDTTYINNRVNTGFLDSTLARQEIDLYVTKNYLETRNVILDSGDVNNLFTSGFTSRFDSNAGNVTASVLPYTGLTTIDLGSTTRRFRNFFTANITATTSIEVDSARITYNPTFNLLNLANTERLRLNEGTDSATVTVNTSGANIPQLFSNATLIPATAVNKLDLGDSNFKWNNIYINGTVRQGSGFLLDSSATQSVVNATYINGLVDSNMFISLPELKSEVAASADFAAFKSRIAAL